MNLSEPFINRPVATSLLMAALVAIGLAAFPFLPVAPLPQVDFPTIQVTASLSGASAETMASSVAAPLERQFGQIAGVTQLTSLSASGVSQVVIQFDLNRNIDSAAQDVQAAITSASKFLPQAMTQPPNCRKVNPADAPILMLRAYSDTLPLTVVHDYLDNFFIQALSQVPGVAQASIIGDQKPSIRIQVDPAKDLVRLLDHLQDLPQIVLSLPHMEAHQGNGRPSLGQLGKIGLRQPYFLLQDLLGGLLAVHALQLQVKVFLPPGPCIFDEPGQHFILPLFQENGFHFFKGVLGPQPVLQDHFPLQAEYGHQFPDIPILGAHNE